MAYETGSYSSPVDLLGKIAAFATARGWSVTSGGAGGDSPGQYSMESEADGLFIHAIAENSSTRIRSMPASGYTSSGTDFFAHSGSANNTSTLTQHVILQPLSGAGVAYHLFGNDSAPRFIHVVAEPTAGHFIHWSFGTIQKYGTWTGGGYSTATSWLPTSTVAGNQAILFDSRSPISASKQYLRCDGLLGRSSPAWSQSAGSLSLGTINGANYPVQTIARQMNPWTGRTSLAPIYSILKAADTDSLLNTSRALILGVYQDVRFVSMDGRNPGEVLTLGSDEWLLFPLRWKPPAPSLAGGIFDCGGSSPDSHSNNFGYAYKRVT